MGHFCVFCEKTFRTFTSLRYHVCVRAEDPDAGKENKVSVLGYTERMANSKKQDCTVNGGETLTSEREKNTSVKQSNNPGEFNVYDNDADSDEDALYIDESSDPIKDVAINSINGMECAKNGSVKDASKGNSITINGTSNDESTEERNVEDAEELEDSKYVYVLDGMVPETNGMGCSDKTPIKGDAQGAGHNDGLFECKSEQVCNLNKQDPSANSIRSTNGLVKLTGASRRKRRSNIENAVNRLMDKTLLNSSSISALHCNGIQTSDGSDQRKPLSNGVDMQSENLQATTKGFTEYIVKDTSDRPKSNISATNQSNNSEIQKDNALSSNGVASSCRSSRRKRKSSFVMRCTQSAEDGSITVEMPKSIGVNGHVIKDEIEQEPNEVFDLSETSKRRRQTESGFSPSTEGLKCQTDINMNIAHIPKATTDIKSEPVDLSVDNKANIPKLSKARTSDVPQTGVPLNQAQILECMKNLQAQGHGNLANNTQLLEQFTAFQAQFQAQCQAQFPNQVQNPMFQLNHFFQFYMWMMQNFYGNHSANANTESHLGQTNGANTTTAPASEAKVIKNENDLNANIVKSDVNFNNKNLTNEFQKFNLDYMHKHGMLPGNGLIQASGMQANGLMGNPMPLLAGNALMPGNGMPPFIMNGNIPGSVPFNNTPNKAFRHIQPGSASATTAGPLQPQPSTSGAMGGQRRKKSSVTAPSTASPFDIDLTKSDGPIHNIIASMNGFQDSFGHEQTKFQVKDNEQIDAIVATLLQAGMVAESESCLGVSSKPGARYFCRICNEKFFHPEHLEKHVRKFHIKKKYQCMECDRSFHDAGNYRQHMRVHDESDIPYQCHLCSRRFRHKCTLKVHMRIHTGEKPFKCSVCGATFKISSGLQTHMRKHTGETPYACEFCSLRFKCQSNLKQHVFQHTQVRPYICDICGKNYSRKSIRDSHMQTHFKGGVANIVQISPEDYEEQEAIEEHDSNSSLSKDEEASN